MDKKVGIFGMEENLVEGKEGSHLIEGENIN